MKAIILIVHGMPPKDFPTDEKLEFIRLHSLVENKKTTSKEQVRRHDELELKMRQWPRTQTNDAFYFASMSIAESLKNVCGIPVYVAFNEFSAPDFFASIDKALADGCNEFTVLTPMLTRGGNHAEEEIPELIQEARQKHPQTSFNYAWPFDTTAIAHFLNQHLAGFLKPEKTE